jgi:hypothetical protein
MIGIVVAGALSVVVFAAVRRQAGFRRPTLARAELPSAGWYRDPPVVIGGVLLYYTALYGVLFAACKRFSVLHGTGNLATPTPRH